MADAPRSNAGRARRSGTRGSLPRPGADPRSPTPPFNHEVEQRRVDVATSGFTGDAAVARRALGDDAARVRAAALAALVRLGELSATEIERLTDDPSPLVRRNLAELAATAGLTSCRRLLADEDAGVVEAACFAVGEIGEHDAVTRLVEIATSHEDALCRESAVAALGALGDRAGLAAVLSALSDRPEIRRRAVVALAAFEGPEVEAALEARLEDRDWQVRQAAEDVLRISDRTSR